MAASNCLEVVDAAEVLPEAEARALDDAGAAESSLVVAGFVMPIMHTDVHKVECSRR